MSGKSRFVRVMTGERSSTIVNDPAGQAKVIDSLRSLLERLGSPELTLPEAKFLRSQISQVLGEISPDRDRSQVYP